MNMKKSGITIVLALSLVLPACSSSSRKAAPKAPEPPKVSLIEPSNPGGNMNAVVFEDMTGVVAATFGTASVFRTVEEALAGNTDIIVFLSITGWGQYGPLCDRAGYDPAAQAFSGWMALNGEPNGGPTKAATWICDDFAEHFWSKRQGGAFSEEAEMVAGPEPAVVTSEVSTPAG